MTGEIVAAHEAAVAEAMTYMEREACRARRGQGGAIVVNGQGFSAAAFRHRASRAGDPLLHTHVVVANATRADDARWTALHGQLLYRHAKTAGYLYQSVLRAELTERLPRSLERGRARDGGHCRRAARRDRALFAAPRRGPGAHGRAPRAIRPGGADRHAGDAPAQGYDVPGDRLREEWRARASDAARPLSASSCLAQPPRRVARDDLAAERVARRLESPQGLTRDQSRFTRRDVLAFAEAARNGERVEQLEQQATFFLSRPAVVALADGNGERRYTTRELLELERGLLDGATARRGGAAGLAGGPANRTAVDARPTLTQEQRQLVQALTQSGDGVQVIRAAAGTGKTFAIGAAVEAWQRSGIAVLGCGLSARAACELRDQTGIDTTTIARLTLAFEQGAVLAPGSILIVDEAGMVGARDRPSRARHARLPPPRAAAAATRTTPVSA